MGATHATSYRDIELLPETFQKKCRRCRRSRRGMLVEYANLIESLVTSEKLDGIIKKKLGGKRMDIKIEELRTLCNRRAIKWTTHIMARLQERGINPSDIKNCIQTGEIIEQYPNDYPYPSCLILGYHVSDKWIHAVIGLGNCFIWLITAYYPNPEKWESDLRTRKEN